MNIDVTKQYFTHYSSVVIFFFNTVYTSLHFHLLFWKIIFSSLCGFCVFCLFSVELNVIFGSRTIASKENCLPTPKLTLTQTLTLTRGHFCSVATVWLPPNPKTNPNLDRNPSPNRGQFSLVGQLSGYRNLHKLYNFI